MSPRFLISSPRMWPGTSSHVTTPSRPMSRTCVPAGGPQKSPSSLSKSAAGPSARSTCRTSSAPAARSLRRCTPSLSFPTADGSMTRNCICGPSTIKAVFARSGTTVTPPNTSPPSVASTPTRRVPDRSFGGCRLRWTSCGRRELIVAPAASSELHAVVVSAAGAAVVDGKLVERPDDNHLPGSRIRPTPLDRLVAGREPAVTYRVSCGSRRSRCSS